MDSLVALTADWYWECDSQCRFTRVDRLAADPARPDDMLAAAVGNPPWDLPGALHPDPEWENFRRRRAEQAAFRDAEWSWWLGQDDAIAVLASGEPIRDGDGRFAGYRGVMRNITVRRHESNALRRFRAAVDISGDPIFIIDRASMRIIDANETACRAIGCSREELNSYGPQDFLLSDRQTLEKDFDELIATGIGTATEKTVRDRDGNTCLFELQRRAIMLDDRWLIVTSARDITQRRMAEGAAVRLGQMYAAISGTNDAILHATTPEDLYQQVCEVAVRSGQIVSASVLLPDPSSEWARFAALAGIGHDSLRPLQISFDEDKVEGRGLVGTAYRSGESCVINDFPNDPRVKVKPWRMAAGKEGAAAGAAIPLRRDGESIGVLLLYSREKDAFDDDIVNLLERMAQNIVFTLENFDRDLKRRKAVDALRQSEERYRSILENMNDGYFEVDLKGNYTVVNDALCRQHNCTRDEALRLNYRNFMNVATAEYVYGLYHRIYRTRQPAELTEHAIQREDGNICIVQTSMQLIIGTDGRPAGFRGISRDVTARRLAEEAVRASEEKYRSILESIEEAYYEVDLTGALMLCNDAFCRMFGYSMSEIAGVNYRRYHSPQDAAHVFANFNEVFKSGIPKKGIDWRLLHRNGKEVMCEGSIHLIRDASGEPAGFRGMLRDVTDRRSIESALRASEERFRDLTKLSSDWYWEQDSRYRFTQINGDVFGKTGMVADDYLGKTLWELPFDNVSLDQWIEHQSLLAEGMPFHELVLCILGTDGAKRYLSISGLPVRDKDGHAAGYRGTGKDITERKTAEERIRHLASHDILTGLPNRMMFHQVLGYQIQLARRYQRKFALMFIDLDHFKAINDVHGHDAGDVVLKVTATRLVDCVRDSDFVARLAGDEFVVIIQEHRDMQHLRALAEKMVAALRASIVLGDVSYTVTASIGVSVFPDHGEDEDALLKRADVAMYAVKRGSKDSFQVSA
ncbi:PAS domain S-box protein [Noviherbaspirillum saxi]|uniref:PAS domain S-box protein n=1 Tax=Noviherbaspirillum saxi TaxID=2320863 RepID=A0A3A3FKW8_9BURK|nr:PAS domain S-box protein [Noviherbaspirillum saxi]RJF96133.1 PAS domain S-box protein [Noviherbaspirillum saxi]